MNKPNLFIPGFPKSGTSSLHHVLSQHPLIESGKTKEPHTYSDDVRYIDRKNPTSSRSFKCIYPKSNRYILDSSSSYLISNQAIKRIIQDTPDAKFIVIGRDPVERIFSHYNWLQSKGIRLNKLDREIAVEKNSSWSFNENIQGKFKFFWQYSMYGTQIKNLENIAGKKSYRFLLYEDFTSNFKKELAAVIDFLEIPPALIEPAIVNSTIKNYHVSKPLSRIGRMLPSEIKAFLKSILWNINYKEPTLENLVQIKSELSLELKILESMGIDYSKWALTESFIKN